MNTIFLLIGTREKTNWSKQTKRLFSGIPQLLCAVATCHNGSHLARPHTHPGHLVIHSQSFHDSLLAGYDWAGEEFLLYFLARGRWKESETGEDSNNRLWFSISVKSVASKFLRHRPRWFQYPLKLWSNDHKQRVVVSLIAFDDGWYNNKQSVQDSQVSEKVQKFFSVDSAGAPEMNELRVRSAHGSHLFLNDCIQYMDQVLYNMYKGLDQV